MEQALYAKHDALVCKQTAWATNGSVIMEREVPVAPEEVQQQADQYIDFLKKTGADLMGSVLSTIGANKLKIDSLLGDIRSSRSPEEVQTLGRALNAAVELSKHLETITEWLRCQWRVPSASYGLTTPRKEARAHIALGFHPTTEGEVPSQCGSSWEASLY